MDTDSRLEKSKITFILFGLVTVIVHSSAGSARADTWTQKTDMPTARHGLSTSVVGGKIYAFGGTGGLKKVEEYDPATDTWTTKADMPTGRVFLASSAVDGKVYAIGGMTVYRGTYLATVEEYDPATDTWTQKADMPAPRAALDTSVVNGRIYAVGGGPERGGYIATMWEYDPATDTWTTKADMQTVRKFVSTSVFHGKIYAFGGLAPNASPALPTVEEYDPVTDTWTQKADMPVPRGVWSTSVVDEKIYAFGGSASKGGMPLSTLFQYELATDTWTAKDDMPVRMIGLSTSVLGGSVYVIGGSSALWPYDPPLSTVWEYDTGLGVPSPDFNGDGIVDSRDVSVLVDHWHTDNALYDIAPLPFGDDIVDVQDLIFLSEHLFEEVDDPTLIAHWALDETEGSVAHNSADNSNSTIVGLPVWQPDGGKVDGALELTGTTFIMGGFVLNPSGGPFSVLAWVKGGQPGQGIITQQGGVDWLMAHAVEGKLATELGRSLRSETVITDGDWHRIGVTWDGSACPLYVDDVLEAQSEEDALAGSAGRVIIGCRKTMAPGTFFTGLIDDIRIYNRVVSP